MTVQLLRQFNVIFNEQDGEMFLDLVDDSLSTCDNDREEMQFVDVMLVRRTRGGCGC